MIHRFFALAILPGLSLAQFRSLVTTDDGSLLLFSSRLQLQGTTEYSWDKLFSIDSSGLSLYEQRQEQSEPSPSRLSNFYLMDDADLSGDGSIRALITGRVCVIPGSGCFIGNYFVQSEVSGLPPQNPIAYPGKIRISRNGRYGFVCCVNQYQGFSGLLDLTTGASKPMSVFPNYLTRGMVASTGTVVLPEQTYSLQIATLTSTREIATSAKTVRAVLDDNATLVVYEGQYSDGTELLSKIDPGTGAELILLKAPDANLVGMTYDGQLIAFLSDAKLTSTNPGGVKQLYSVRADGSGLRQITQDPAGLVEATLARGGAVAYAVTAAGRLLKIDMASGTATVLIERTLTLQTPPSSGPIDPVAGSAYCVSGTGLADSGSTATPPLPSSLGGLQLLLDQNPLPLQSVTPGQVCFQLPWDTAMGDHTLTAVTNSDPRFQPIPNAELLISFSAMPNFLPLGPQYRPSVSLAPYALASHEDFRGPLTRTDPARPGEIVHFWMTGLGPVDRPVPTGAAAPTNPPPTVAGGFACQFSAVPSGYVTAPVLFAGLAPGTVGYYQATVQVPLNVPIFYGDALIVCSTGRSGNTAWIPVYVATCPALGLTDPGKRRRVCLETSHPSGSTHSSDF